MHLTALPGLRKPQLVLPNLSGDQSSATPAPRYRRDDQMARGKRQV